VCLSATSRSTHRATKQLKLWSCRIQSCISCNIGTGLLQFNTAIGFVVLWSKGRSAEVSVAFWVEHIAYLRQNRLFLFSARFMSVYSSTVYSKQNLDAECRASLLRGHRLACCTSHSNEVWRLIVWVRRQLWLWLEAHYNSHNLTSYTHFGILQVRRTDKTLCKERIKLWRLSYHVYLSEVI
jgi:hypothetical protein